MKNIFKSIKESNGWKWLNSNPGYTLLMIVVMIFITAVVYVSTNDTNKLIALKTLEKKTENISKRVDEQVTTIKSLTEENAGLKEKVNKLKAKKVQEKDNIKNYILTYYKTVAPIIAEEAAVHILEKSAKHNVPFVAVVAVMEVESHFNPFAISPKGARGLMQVMPGIWVKELGLSNKYNLHDIETSVDCGVRILRRYLDATDNDMRKALFKYVGGSHPYIKKVYESMGKFIVFKSFSDIKVSEEEDTDSVTSEVSPDNDKVESKVVEIPIDKTMFTHTIVEGQTLGLIAKHYTGKIGNWTKILEANPSLVPERLPIGAVVTIPNSLLKTVTPLK
jgi:nucleoid-associated protein YgaU